MENCGVAAMKRDGTTHYVTEVLYGFSAFESRAQKALRENNTGADPSRFGAGRGGTPF